ncbi:flagellar hook-basal body protein [Mobilitalea sibirica]|uniref:Flagellar hook-basal body protein n=1 Tax=Mobilitalea sibirica TaxID=1462919 RepID=A0A8J7L0I4_9FIRM|nr:flagellar hook-basal body protein [Mobilitalea sibirica]MBH1942453.1 flagellar hook-basal body protein [Mobilitalea sibirica]
MVRGLYTAYTGMANEQKRLDIIANNLANSATVGYKEENVTNQAFDDVLTIKIRDASEAYNDRPIGKMSLGVKLGEVYTSFSQGSLRQTANPYNLALEGKGFFQMSVTDRAGNESIKYTRNGSFTMTKDGHIVDVDGNRLMGEAGEIMIPLDAVNVTVDEGGAIYTDGNYLDTIIITDFENYDYLIKSGDTMYQTVEGATQIPGNALVRQGFTEQSNVNVVSEMVEMISVTRAYEANQKVIQSVDRTLELAANTVGKV